MAGYSSTPLAAKLGIRPASTLVILGAPPHFTLDLPPDVVVRRQARGPVNVVLAFHTRSQAMRRAIEGLSQLIVVDGALWIAWPKKSSRAPTDVTDHVVREIALPLGLVDNKVCAIDDTWTGLRLVWRKENRA